MKNIIVATVMIICILIVAGCTTNTQLEKKSTGSKFVELESSEWVEFSQLVREYFYYKKQAVLEDDINIMWERYPHLQKNSDATTGINNEIQWISLQGDVGTIIDGNINIEAYDRIKMNRVSDSSNILLVHAFESYVRDDFEESGGEILIELHLEKIDDEWDIKKTDEYTLEEYKEWIDAR